MCNHRISDHPNGLMCQRDDHPEHPNGHLYRGSSVPDMHDTTEAAAEDER